MQEAKTKTSDPDERAIGVHRGQTTDRAPCSDCPWRLSNHGKRHPGGFFRKDNLRRLWNQIRKGGGMQTCHPTDPSHPDHRKYGGAKEDADTLECIGSVVLVTREMLHAARLGKSNTTVDVTGAELYLKQSPARKGLTRAGLLWAAVVRTIPMPVGIGIPMPALSQRTVDSEEIGRPDEPARLGPIGPDPVSAPQAAPQDA